MAWRFPFVMMVVGTGCTAVLPEAPADCVGPACGCQAHTDCPLERPQCLVGACIESEDKSVAWAHRHQVLPGEGPTHSVDLGQPIDINKAPLLTGMTLSMPEEEAAAGLTAPTWVVAETSEGHRVAAHRQGLLVFRPAPGDPIVWQPDPTLLTANGPGVHPDLRSLVGYGMLRAITRRMASLGMIDTVNPVRVLNEAEHKVELSEPLHLLISDLLGPAKVLPEGIGLGAQTALMDRAYALPHSGNLAHSEYPRRTELPRRIGRSLLLHLSQPATLIGTARMVPRHPSCATPGERPAGESLRVEVRIDQGQPERWIPEEESKHQWVVPAGEHRIEMSYDPMCSQTEGWHLPHWLRFALISTAPIELISWRTKMPLPIDDNARPVLYNEDAGLLLDSDGDHWPNASDLCPQTHDDQRDGDQDGLGDACDGLYAYKLENGVLSGLDRDGEIIRSIEDAEISRDSFARALSFPKLATYPDSPERNFHARELVLITQSKKGRPTKIFSPHPELDFHLPFLRTSGEDEPDESDLLLSAADAYGTSVVLQYAQPARPDFHAMVMINRAFEQSPRDFSYLIFGHKPAFELVKAHHPVLLLSGENLGDSAFTALRLPAFPFLRYPSLLTLPPGPDCETTCDPVSDGDEEMPMVCLLGKCRPDLRVGQCIALGNPIESSVARCEAQPLGRSCADQACSEDELCMFDRCYPIAAAAQGCPPRQACIPQLGAAFLLHETISNQLKIKALGVVQPLPVTDESVDEAQGFLLSACARELVGLHAPMRLSPAQQRNFIRRLFSPSIKAEDLFEFARLPMNWANDPDPPWNARCSAMPARWRAHFSSNLLPVRTDLVDTDGDGIDEVRVGFTLGRAAPDTEPSVYRCYDFAAEEREQNCAPQ